MRPDVLLQMYIRARRGSAGMVEEAIKEEVGYEVVVNMAGSNGSQGKATAGTCGGDDVPDMSDMTGCQIRIFT
jgi:hypothetical protein